MFYQVYDLLDNNPFLEKNPILAIILMGVIIVLLMVLTPFATRAEILKDDINSRVFTALKDNGIEIPYNYETIIVKQDKKEAAEVKATMNA